MTDSVDLSAGYSYVPEHFRQTDAQCISETIARHPFATLVVNGAPYPLCAQLPFLHFGQKHQPDSWLFESHLARKNPVAQNLDAQPESNSNALLVFHGPDAYINPYWYVDSQETSVPTWNYQAVHIRGQVSLVKNQPEQWLDQHLNQLIATHQTRIYASGFDYHHLPEKQRQSMLKAIVGLRFIPKAIDAIDKLSQNKTSADRSAVVQALSQPDRNFAQQATAALMAQISLEKDD